jgi:hypothetical protein
LDATNVDKAFETILSGIITLENDVYQLMIIERYKTISQRQLEGSAEPSNGPSAGTKINIAPPSEDKQKSTCC